jgi:uncharacterized membrane protein
VGRIVDWAQHRRPCYLLGWLTILIWPFIGLAGLVLWIILLIKANQGQMYKLPLIGDLAEKQANA